MQINLNVDDVVTHFGGAAPMAEYFTSRGYKLTVANIGQWRARGRIPMKAWLSMCGVYLKASGNQLNLWDFIEVRGSR